MGARLYEYVARTPGGFASDLLGFWAYVRISACSQLSMRVPFSPYPVEEFLSMVRRRFSSPPPRPESLDRALRLRKEPLERTVGFVGDICPLFGREVQFGAGVRSFFDDCDVVVGNLEGVFSDRYWQPFLMKHRPSIVKVLDVLAPLDRWVLTVANNHATDFGPEALHRTTEFLNRRGIRWLGTEECPRLWLAEDVTLTAWTRWLNRPDEGVARDDPGVPADPGLHVALPHWGYEHERQPRSSQVPPEGYDLVVGHHTHLPQPFERHNDHRLVAWSLGNFVTGKQLSVLGEGAILKVGMARSGDEAPEIVRADFREIELDRDQQQCRVTFRFPAFDAADLDAGTDPASLGQG